MLKEIKNTMTFSEVDEFILEHEELITDLSKTNECRKWNKWLTQNAFVYPCVCPSRNEDCIFMEVYHELYKNNELVKYESNCVEALLDYHSIKSDPTSVRTWFRTNYKLKNIVSEYKDSISVVTSKQPTEQLKIEVQCPNGIKNFILQYGQLLENYYED
jgi:hypothetical protein